MSGTVTAAVDERIVIPAPVHGGQDPDDMNLKRTNWGHDLCAKIMELTGTDKEDAPGDAIANILHAAHDIGLDPAMVMRQAVSHFNAETGEG